MKSDIITIRINRGWNYIEFQLPATALPLLRQSLQQVNHTNIDGTYLFAVVDEYLTVELLEGLTTLRKIEEVSND